MPPLLHTNLIALTLVLEQKLYIARHAHAEALSPDADRPLSEKGLKQIRRIAQALAGKSLIIPDSIWHSGYLRALETAQELAHGLSLNVPLKQVDDLTPYDHPQSVARLIQHHSENLLITGHEPNLSTLASLLLDQAEEGSPIIFEKASILCLTRMKVGEQSTSWQIQWHLSHKFFK